MSRRTAIINKPCPDAYRSAVGCTKANCLFRHDLENIKKATKACMTKGCVYRTNSYKPTFIQGMYGMISVHYCRDCFKSQRT